MNSASCPLCAGSAKAQRWDREDGMQVECPRCGSYGITGEAADVARAPQGILQNCRHIANALTRTSLSPRKITTEVLNAIDRGDIPDRSMSEKLTLFLSSLCETRHELGKGLLVDPDNDYPVAWCRSAGELNWLIGTAKDLQWIRVVGHKNGALSMEVLANGWLRHEERRKAKGSQVFVAMAFNRDFSGPLMDAIRNGVAAAGYRAVTVAEELHNQGIFDKIIAMIKDSRFVVADLKANRGGVYYEAGFARGLGMEVFLTSHADQLVPGNNDPIHFDVAHMHINTWTDDTLDAFAENLKNRVLAVVGRGPLESTAK